MGAKRLFMLGAVSFWLPETILYAYTRQAVGGKFLTFLLPASLLAVYSVVLIYRPKRIPKPSAALFMVLGVVFSGTLAIAVGATIRGAGFVKDPGSTLLGVVIGTVIPIYAFISATYDGSLYALLFVSILMPLLHFSLERENWLIPPKKPKVESLNVG